MALEFENRPRGSSLLCLAHGSGTDRIEGVQSLRGWSHGMASGTWTTALLFGEEFGSLRLWVKVFCNMSVVLKLSLVYIVSCRC